MVNKLESSLKKKEYSTTKPLEIIHADVCGPMRTIGLNGERYFLLFVDDFTRMIGLFLLKKKSETFSCFQVFKELTENEIDMKIKCLRSDNGGEFVSNEFNNYCDENGIKIHFSITETPQQNGVVERKNIIVMEMARTILNESRLNDMFWPQVVHTAVHILNISLLRNNTNNTPYQLWKGIPANIKHFRIFGSKCYIKRIDKNMGKLDSRTDEGLLVGYSCSRKAYKCYNFILRKIVESIDVKFDESSFLKSKSKQKHKQIHEIYDKHKMDKDVSETEETKTDDNEQLIPTSIQGTTPFKSINPCKTPSKRIQKNHLEEQIIGDINSGIGTRSRRIESTSTHEHVSLLSLIEPKNIE
jgi:hypothetical protein